VKKKSGIAVQRYRHSEKISPSTYKVENLDCLNTKNGNYSPNDTALPLQQHGCENHKPRKLAFMFIPIILNNECLSYTNICTNKWHNLY